LTSVTEPWRTAAGARWITEIRALVSAVQEK
jgi:hypothetical protein